MACVVSTDVALTLNARWGLNRQVAVRPEPFGALLYHFGTRKLSFVKDPRLLAVVQLLEESPTVADALQLAGVAATDLPAFRRALQMLADSSMIEPKEPVS